MTHSLKTTDLHCIHGQFEHIFCSQTSAAFVFLYGKKKVFDFWLNFILVNHNISVTMSSMCDPNYNQLFWCLSVVKYCKNINKMHCCTYCAILNSNSTKLKCPKLLNKPCVFCPSNLICFINRTNQLRWKTSLSLLMWIKCGSNLGPQNFTRHQTKSSWVRVGESPDDVDLHICGCERLCGQKL